MIYSRTRHAEPAFPHLLGAVSALNAAPSFHAPTMAKTRSVVLQARWPVSPVLRENTGRATRDDRLETVTGPFPARLPV